MLDFLITHWGVIAAILFLLSELIGEIPSVRASSVFGIIVDLLRGEVKKSKPDLDRIITRDSNHV